MDLRSGQRVGPWTLNELLGEGGNSQVWGAKRADERQAALKILHTRNVTSEPYQRFRDEIRFLRSDLGQHPGVLPLLEAFAPEQLKAGEHAWLAMPRAVPIRIALDGAPTAVTVGAVAEFAETLAALAARDVAHRDLKPPNLFRLEERWVIGDFGLVDFPTKDDRTLPDRRLGPMYFIAPEMLGDSHVSAGGPADVYSLAKTLWVLVTGQRYPPPGTHRQGEEAFRLGLYVAEPRVTLLDALIEACTRHDPTRRPSIVEVARNLRAWLDRSDVVAGPADLAELRNRLTALTAPARQEEEDRRAKSQFAEGALRRLRDEFLEPIHVRFGGFEGARAITTGSTEVFAPFGLGHGDVAHRAGWSSILAYGDPPTVTLHALGGAQLTRDGKLVVIGGLGMKTPRGAEVLWRQVREEIPGGPGQEQAVSAVGQALVAELPNALGKLAAALEPGTPVDRMPEPMDIEAPRLLAFTVTPGTIDVSHSSQELVIRARITDDLSGVSSGAGRSPSQARFQSPSKTQFVDAIFAPSRNLVEGSVLDGVYEDHVTVRRYSERGG